MGKALVVLGVVALVLVGGLGGTYLWLTAPVALAHYEEPVSVATRQRNAEIYSTLESVGITEAFINIDATRTYLAYARPNETAYANDTLQAFVLGVGASFAEQTAGTIVVVEYVDQVPVLLWEGDLAGARAVQAGTADSAAYLASVKKTTL